MSQPLSTATVGSLYLHIPFCERRCEYCDFAAVAGLRGHEAYVAALRSEVRALAGLGGPMETVFIGGGTPSLLPPELLATVLDEVRQCLGIAPGAEVTMEANPSSTTGPRLQAWLQAGVNRVSLGVQSLDDAALRFLGRVHDAAAAREAMWSLRDSGVPRWSVDLIHSVPGLDDDAWRRTLDTVLEHGPRHLSCYELTVEEGTPLHRRVAAGAARVVDDETALRQHWLAVDTAAAAGLRQYEVSNLAVPGDECRHNLVYWSNRHWLAAGCGAHGHVPAALAAVVTGTPAEPGDVAVRYWHHRDPAAYVTAVAGGRPLAGFEAVGAGQHEAERVMVGLRLARGVRLEAPAAREEAARLAAGGLLEWDGTVARATRRGQDVLNSVAATVATAA